jgi:hypothetical protein
MLSAILPGRGLQEHEIADLSRSPLACSEMNDSSVKATNRSRYKSQGL